MINPAEDIVNIWLQEHYRYFVISNIVVPLGARLSASGRRVGGGRGKEVDFFATDGNGKYYWVEVSVSPNPRLPGGAERSRDILVDNALKKFDKGNEQWLFKHYKIKKLEKWFIYSPKLFSFFRDKSVEEQRYINRLKEKDITAVSFTDVLKNIYNELNYMGYDAPRQYLFLLKKFGYGL